MSPGSSVAKVSDEGGAAGVSLQRLPSAQSASVWPPLGQARGTLQDALVLALSPDACGKLSLLLPWRQAPGTPSPLRCSWTPALSLRARCRSRGGALLSPRVAAIGQRFASRASLLAAGRVHVKGGLGWNLEWREVTIKLNGGSTAAGTQVLRDPAGERRRTESLARTSAAAARRRRGPEPQPPHRSSRCPPSPPRAASLGT